MASINTDVIRLMLIQRYPICYTEKKPQKAAVWICKLHINVIDVVAEDEPSYQSLSHLKASIKVFLMKSLFSYGEFRTTELDIVACW